MLDTHEGYIIDKSVKQIINFELIDKIINLKEGSDTHDNDEITFGSNTHDIENILKQISTSSSTLLSLEALFNEYTEDEVRIIHTFYYYGRSFTDGSMSITTSFWDLFDHNKDISYDDILEKITGVQTSVLINCFDVAKENFDEHEKNVPKEKEVFEKRLKLYTKDTGHTFFEFPKKENKESTHKTFINVFEKFGTHETSDINTAKQIIETIIEETNSWVVVDFLGSENFDHLDYVENDDEVLKLYWKYSSGNNQYPIPPHNTRIDIAFEKLELIKYKNNVAIALKGYYRSKTEVKNYYCNQEKIKKLYSNDEMKWSLFIHELNFDKQQRGALENFNVTFLPWRYYNILILPKENLPSVGATTKILILKNLFDIKNTLKNTMNEFETNYFENEEFITMYGNRFRKIVEKLLKFILLASKIMFKENYEKDMLGSILEQIKNEVKREKNYLDYYDKDILPLIISELEDTGLLEQLNLCSHDNVKHKINKEIIDTIYGRVQNLLQQSYKYFKLNI